MHKLAKVSLLSMAMMTVSLFASDILVTVNGKNITKQDAQAFINTSAPQVNFMELPTAEKKMVIDKLIEKHLFTELALQEGIDKKPEFKRNLEKIKDDLLINIWLKSQLDNAIVSESEAKDFYDKNSEKFMEKPSMHARHILLKEEQDAQEIIDILKSLKGEALKEKFIELANKRIELANAELAKSELAKSKSIQPSPLNGGDLGTVTEDQVGPVFAEAALKLQNGQITIKPVQTKFGYHVIYLETKTEAKPTSYEKVKNSIITSLKQQQFTVKIKEVAKELKSKAKIVDMTTEVNATKK